MERDGLPNFIAAIAAAVVLGAIVMAGIILLAVFSLI